MNGNSTYLAIPREKTTPWPLQCMLRRMCLTVAYIHSEPFWVAYVLVLIPVMMYRLKVYEFRTELVSTMLSGTLNRANGERYENISIEIRYEKKILKNRELKKLRNKQEGRERKDFCYRKSEMGKEKPILYISCEDLLSFSNLNGQRGMAVYLKCGIPERWPAQNVLKIIKHWSTSPRWN